MYVSSVGTKSAESFSVNPIVIHMKWAGAVMVAYNSILHVCELCGDEVCREFFSEPNSNPHEVSGSWTNNCQFLRPPPLVRTFLNEATIDLELLAALEQFEDQAANRLPIAVLEEYEDSGTTQKDVKKTPAKMLPSTLSKHCM